MADTYTVERSALVNAPPARVYGLVADFHEWVRWSPWEDLDPQQERSYSGAESGVGAAYAWRGNRKAGQGRMAITGAKAPERVEIALEFEKPFRSSNTTAFLLQPEGEATRVTWSMTGPKTPLLKLMGLVRSMDTMVGRDFEKGLARLKTTAEAPAT
ncbi:MAG: SRPBCC family protein [Actinomycetes bacterium]